VWACLSVTPLVVVSVVLARRMAAMSLGVRSVWELGALSAAMSALKAGQFWEQEFVPGTWNNLISAILPIWTLVDTLQDRSLADPCSLESLPNM